MSFDSGSDRKLRCRGGRRYYVEEDIGVQEEVGQMDTARTFSVEEKLTSDKFDESFVKFMNGNELNVDYVRRHGFFTPLVFKEKGGLGIRLPPAGFSVYDVKELVGGKRIVDVMDVSSQQALEMFMDDWVDYYTAPERQLLLNVISLEFSHTPMEKMVQSPRVVRDLDWVDIFWPSHLKKAQKEGTNDMASMKYPKVQKYCLMSVGGCYTDFHVDFGGTSVWYHLIRGEKVFWLIPPTPQNLVIYEKWVKSGRQQDIFLGDMVEKCGKVHLYEGYTFMIPTGWIHAVYTPCDSLVVGGNFLHSFNIEGQLIVSEIEAKTKVPLKFRYPFFVEMLWHVLSQYAEHVEMFGLLSDNDGWAADELSAIDDGEAVHPTGINQLSMYEIRGLLSLVAKMEKSPTWKKRAPESVGNPNELLVKMKELLRGYNIQYNYMSTVWKEERLKTVSSDFLSQSESEGCHNSTVDGLQFGDHDYFKQLDRQKRSHVSHNTETDDWNSDSEWVNSELLLSDSSKQQECNRVDKASEDDEYTPQERERPHVNRSGSNLSSKKYKRKHRCGECTGCLASDCIDCRFCLDMIKYGGTGKLRQACMNRKCLAMICPGDQSELPRDKSTSVTSNSQLQKKAVGSRFRGVRATSSNQAAKRVKSERKHAANISRREDSVSALYPNLSRLPSLEEDGSDLFTESSITPLEVDDSDLGIMMSDVCGLAPEDVQLGEMVVSVNTQRAPTTSNSSATTDPNWKERQTARKEVQDLLTGRRFAHKDTHSQKTRKRKKQDMTPIREHQPKPKDNKLSEDPVHQMAEANRVKSSFKIPKRCDGGSRPRVCSLASPPSAYQPSPHVSSHAHAQSPSYLSDCNHSEKYASVSHKPQPVRTSPISPRYTFSQKERTRRSIEVNVTRDPRRTSLHASLVKMDPAQPSRITKSTAHAAALSAVDSELEVVGLARKQWVLIFSFLGQYDVCSCMLVCQAFYSWVQDPCLWHTLNLSRVESITAATLTGIRKRQPQVLDLSWTGVTQKQLRWLLNKLTLLNELRLTGCSKAIVPALVDCKPFPPLRVLDLGWIEGLNDQSIHGLFAMPNPSVEKPVSVKHLRLLQELRLTGTCITDATFLLLSKHSSCLVKLDCSYCSLLTDRAIEWLTSVGSPSRDTLQVIDLSGCTRLTGTSIPHFGRCSQLQRLDLRMCEEVTVRACGRLVASSRLPLILKEDKLIERSP